MRHARRVVWLQRLAGRRRRAGDTALAEGLYWRGLAIAERHLPADHLATARVRNDLAVLLKYTGGFDEAAELYAAACEVLTARLGAEHPEVATVLQTSAVSPTPPDGPPTERQPLDARSRSVMPPSAPTIPTPPPTAALAAILAATGRHDEARALLEVALAVFQRAVGDDHHEVAVTLGNLGALDAQHGDLASAERRLRRALAINERTLGQDHLELAATLGTLGVIRRRQGDTLEARELHTRALALYEPAGLSTTRTSRFFERTSNVQLRSPRQPRRTIPDANGDLPLGSAPVLSPRLKTRPGRLLVSC